MYIATFCSFLSCSLNLHSHRMDGPNHQPFSWYELEFAQRPYFAPAPLLHLLGPFDIYNNKRMAFEIMNLTKLHGVLNFSRSKGDFQRRSDWSSRLRSVGFGCRVWICRFKGTVLIEQIHSSWIRMKEKRKAVRFDIFFAFNSGAKISNWFRNSSDKQKLAISEDEGRQIVLCYTEIRFVVHEFKR